MGEIVAERHLWALDVMNIAPSDRILEIGCGYGHMASLICSHLIEGRITAIDRSEKMIQAAKKRTAPFMSLDKVRFVTASIHEADLGTERFDKVFAVNVNVFWMKAERELAAIKQHLLPDGHVYLFIQPPAPGRLRTISDLMSHNLLEAGFTVSNVVVEPRHPVQMVCVISKM
ncbi:class I SAM-dependent methyltransferase [Paenibacillus mendelii]|uniref:Class I SAM-dependent methyltransferase n=1 Tax=Paenibacillus mendelii TaxID=206163 RepID=A0ABV6JL95_9BACL|nr:class I SAM-dependent methyltransferase [Paenibacillus mendelii]MCQ6559894.1 class I SAM-dependent methyltransferase [Paenibacillus mendelii]